MLGKKEKKLRKEERERMAGNMKPEVNLMSCFGIKHNGIGRIS